jgi:hypothetical protein
MNLEIRNAGTANEDREWTMESGIEAKLRRRGIFVETPLPTTPSSVRSGIF